MTTATTSEMNRWDTSATTHVFIAAAGGTAYCPHQLQNPSLGPSVLWARFVLIDTGEISRVSIDTKGIQGKNVLVILEYHHGATLRSIAGGDPDGGKDPEVLVSPMIAGTIFFGTREWSPQR